MKCGNDPSMPLEGVERDVVEWFAAWLVWSCRPAGIRGAAPAAPPGAVTTGMAGYQEGDTEMMRESSPPTDADVVILAEENFTLARVNNATVAVLWGTGPYFVTDGLHSPARPYPTSAEAMGELQRLAMGAAGGGAASVVHATAPAGNRAERRGNLTRADRPGSHMRRTGRNVK